MIRTQEQIIADLRRRAEILKDSANNSDIKQVYVTEGTT